MKKIALTGGIATGKSYVLERFRQRGIPGLDADSLAHGVMAAGTEAAAAIAERFGAGVLKPDGSVDRQTLGPLVFADAGARRALEAIVHPAVYRAIEAGLRAIELTGGAPFVVVDVPLLYETGRASRFDAVIATLAPAAVQRSRLRARGLSPEEAEQRLAAQLPAAEKAARADFVIHTDGTFAETDAQVDAIIDRLNQPAV
jgi:dephospho-CoA kinase